MKTKTTLLFIVLSAITVLLFVVDLTVGSVKLTIPEVWNALGGKGDASIVKIVQNIRLMKAVAAILCGLALSASGLQMQTLFHNPLAGPYVLGITSGASLGVAIFVLGAPFLGALSGNAQALGIAGAAWLGSALLLAVIGGVSVRINDIMIILILGMMFSSGIGAVVQILQYVSHEDALKTFIVWTMGSLGDITTNQLWIFIPAIALGTILAVATVKPLNLMLMGEQYAVTMGLNVKKSRNIIFLSTTLLAGTTTAFCGPIGFIGMAVPHVARGMYSTSDARVLLPASMLIGIGMMLLCDIISKSFVLPINSITAILGIPIVIWVVMRNKNKSV